MENYKNFEKFKIKPTRIKELFGGGLTSVSSDTSQSGDVYDIEFQTYDSQGEPTELDNSSTSVGEGSRDYPSDKLNFTISAN
ncbi:hypothetical protein [Flavobacterium sp. CS20]|uniref:hypothetical protein n=1 Tax=Flavobacterium sp. CS20 TaxID=2775246 RepID=UPI001B3A4B35|nr:hypothetical protein [Flavobacterium sp. CS20]QTY26001.1 hypothetical protein IGB25_08260 [Flavobacterium sp. CS20]